MPPPLTVLIPGSAGSDAGPSSSRTPSSNGSRRTLTPHESLTSSTPRVSSGGASLNSSLHLRHALGAGALQHLDLTPGFRCTLGATASAPWHALKGLFGQPSPSATATMTQKQLQKQQEEELQRAEDEQLQAILQYQHVQRQLLQYHRQQQQLNHHHPNHHQPNHLYHPWERELSTEGMVVFEEEGEESGEGLEEEGVGPVAMNSDPCWGRSLHDRSGSQFQVPLPPAHCDDSGGDWGDGDDGDYCENDDEQWGLMGGGAPVHAVAGGVVGAVDPSWHPVGPSL